MGGDALQLESKDTLAYGSCLVAGNRVIYRKTRVIPELRERFTGK